ncbi:MAG: site-specific DNA-methyltransferase, partial [Puniceicoccales bacterium]|nr:site-specific DNA-methyltransferase [Puniceicoccales bacterium]
INVDSLWLIGERDKSGKHSNVYHGNFIPQIPNQFLRRYTKEGETVLELFSGSGTTLFECETLKRRFIGFDINTEMIKTVRAKMENSQAKFQINECDVTNSADFSTAMNHSLSALRTTQMQFLIAHPVYTKCEVVPLGSYVLDAIKRNFKVKLRGIFA